MNKHISLVLAMAVSFPLTYLAIQIGISHAADRNGDRYHEVGAGLSDMGEGIKSSQGTASPCRTGYQRARRMMNQSEEQQS